MKQITKIQVIELMDAICCDGMDNSNYNLSCVIQDRNSQELYGGEDGIILKPGAYCAIYSGEYDLSDFPKVAKFINNHLSEDNFELIFNGDNGSIFIICLDLF